MNGEDETRRKGGIRGDTKRAERLAAELRANLSRRKQRARKVAAQKPSNDDATQAAGGPEAD